MRTAELVPGWEVSGGGECLDLSKSWPEVEGGTRDSNAVDNKGSSVTEKPAFVSDPELEALALLVSGRSDIVIAMSDRNSLYQAEEENRKVVHTYCSSSLTLLIVELTASM